MTLTDILDNLNDIVASSDRTIHKMTEEFSTNPLKAIRWNVEDVAIACIEKQHALRYINFIKFNESNDEQKIKDITKDIRELSMEHLPSDISSMSARLIDNYATPKALRNIYRSITGLLS